MGLQALLEAELKPDSSEILGELQDIPVILMISTMYFNSFDCELLGPSVLSR